MTTATQLETIQSAVVGVGGYSGMELARLLLHHPRLRAKPPVFAGRADSAHGESPTPLTAIHPKLMDNNGSGALVVEPFSWELFSSRNVEVLFLATPHEQSREWVPEALDRGIRVIDLSGAWRLNDSTNRAVYKFSDEGSDTAVTAQAKSVYGMPELHRERNPRRSTRRKSRLLRNLDHPRPQAARGKRLDRHRPRNRLRLQVRSLRRR